MQYITECCQGNVSSCFLRPGHLSHFGSTMTRNRAFGGVHTRCQASFSRPRFYTTSRLSNRMPTYQFNSLHYTTRGTRDPTLSSRLASMMMDLSNTDISVIPQTRRQGPSTRMDFHDERRRTVNSLPSLMELKDDGTQLHTEYTKINKRIEMISRSIETQEDHAPSRRCTRSRGKTQSARQLQSALQQLDKTRAEYQVALRERERLQALIKHKAEDIRDHPSRAASAAPQESSRTKNARRFSTPATISDDDRENDDTEESTEPVVTGDHPGSDHASWVPI